MLLSAIFMIVLLAGLMAGIAALSGQSSQRLIYEVQALQARLAAEAVLERKVYELLADIEEIDSVTATLGACDAEADAATVSAAGITQVRVLARGRCSTGALTVQRHIEVEVIE
ncbi:hypothetical protein C7H85_02805 [Zobellella endophytica]|uniref:Uncharacterized protein n=2 Tax=Zobellella endophytica TaxID=2116700 RepID=A0A2P7RC07_9GAMM|nr:hypothetical protein C7H85_02805 [Zobellella endophytica]